MFELKFNRVTFCIWIIVLIYLLNGCSHQTTEESNSPKEQNNIPKEENLHIGLKEFNPPIDVHFVRETGQGLRDLIDNLPNETLEDNRWNDLYMSELGIDVEYDWIAEGDVYFRKLGSVLASGNLPDVLKVNAQQLRQLSNANLIHDLTDTYENYATPFTKEIMNQEGRAPIESAMLEGKLMAIPIVASSVDTAEFLWIRTDWLKKLNLASPKTMKEVLAISKAFANEDPDDNGINDTYGLAITKHFWDPSMGITSFFAGYDAYPKLWIENNQGELEYGAIQSEVKIALKSLQKMYSEGQLDAEFFLKNGDRVKKDIANGKIGMLYGEQWSSFLVGSSLEENPSAKWKAFPIVSSSDKEVKVPLKFGLDQFFVVRKDYAYPEAIIKMINLHLEKNWGDSAEYTKYYSTPLAVWQLSPVTPYPSLKNLDAFKQLRAARLSGDVDLLKDEAKSIYTTIQNYMENGDLSGWGWELSYGSNGAYAILDAYIEKNQLLSNQFTGPPTNTMIEKGVILDNYMHDTFMNIILGSPLDEFDDFVDKWHQMGGKKITEEVNEWYRTYK
ncbi:extracellular solute-binding protein [Gracilibacillus marinus]|uniref:Extracellular solute-binding protein n=1 Tax=Gracilibacillus marinus TaxID=630535 RepID=A0ABV8W0M1_9BACI